MSTENSQPIDERLLATLPEWAANLIRSQAELIKSLQERVASLEAQLRQNSRNSSRPPSSDGLRNSRPLTNQKRKQKPGGQPGHEKNERPRLDPTEVREVFPESCKNCAEKLSGFDPEPRIHQWMELPDIQPIVIEYQLHRLTCPKCGKETKAEPPVEHQRAFGPKVYAHVAHAIAVFRFSKRKLSQLLLEWIRLPVCAGTICKMQGIVAKAIQPGINEIHDSIQNSANPLNVDETGFRSKGKRAFVWFAGNEYASRFHIDKQRNRKAFKKLVGSFDGPITTDRFSVYNHWDPGKRQFCWAHLFRDFEAVVQDKNATSWIGENLGKQAKRMFRIWSKVRDGILTRSEFANRYLPGLQSRVRRLLNEGFKHKPMRIGVLAKELLAKWSALWLFAVTDGIEPTNNEAERQLRELVIYRKVCIGVQSEQGAEFLAGMHSIVSTCRKQYINALKFISETVGNYFANTTPPKLIAVC